MNPSTQRKQVSIEALALRARAPGQLLDFLELDIPEDHFHRRAGVELEGDDAFVGHLGEFVVHRRLAVELDGDVLADAA